MSLLSTFFMDPYPLRSCYKQFVRRCGLFGYERRMELGAFERPYYGFCVYEAGRLAKKLGLERMSVLEFGVAGGVGLLNLEAHAEEIERIFGVRIEVYGFDAAKGLPIPLDHRDLPYHWRKGEYKMDVEGLRSRLRRAKLILGDVEETAEVFFEEYDPAPIGAISYDLDFYSSTSTALKVLEGEERFFLPRVFCYFDDTVGMEGEHHTDFTGERLAIHEFNEGHEQTKLGVSYDLLGRKVVEPWHHKIRIAHRFGHPRYNEYVGPDRKGKGLPER